MIMSDVNDDTLAEMDQLVAEGVPDFKLFTVSTENDNVRLAVQWAVAAVTGGQPPAEDTFKGPVFENSVTGQPHPVQCRPDLPGAIYLSAQLPADKQAEAVNSK